MAQRLFQHDAGVGRVQARSTELLTGRGEQVGRGRQIQHHRVRAACAQGLREAFVVGGLGQIHAQVLQQLRELLELFALGALVGLDRVEAAGDQRAVGLVAQIIACDAQNAPARWQRAVSPGLKKGGQQLAPGQVAGAAKQNQIETHGAKNFVKL